jgi:hypothetical protein
LHQNVLKDNKIPNLKHQITNKSQITIFNDRNIHHRSTASLRKPKSAGDETVGHNLDGSFVSNFEFGSLEFIWELAFGAWNFHDLH